MATGMNEHHGGIIANLPELTQRIQRCFRTRLGTLPLHPQYGSNLPNRVDEKVIPGIFNVDVYADVADTLANPANGFSNEFKLVKAHLQLSGNNLSQARIHLQGELLLAGEPIVLEGVQPWQ